MASSSSNNPPARSSLSINIFSNSEPVQAPPEVAPKQESTGLLRGFFGTIKTKFLGAGESVTSTASALYHRNYKYFAIAFAFGCAFIFVSLFFLPLIVISPQKFCLFFSLGSLCIFGSFAFLQDPWEYLTGLFTGDKLMYSIAYIGSLLLSIYASLIAKNYIATIVVTISQVFIRI